MNDDRQRDPEPTCEQQAEPTNERRVFLRTAIAVGAGVAGAGVVSALGTGEALALSKASAFEFSTNIAPAALTQANIKRITDRVAAVLAQEARSGLEVAPSNFHVRVGGSHSRVFSKTAEHKNVSHSEVIVEGSIPKP